ncbi:MAG TPA: hypothetical protein VG815_17820 [Chloroflexota bacterium]|jgi:hypothetical protein|nr:hypothetical protein [Chloroflexota bacterium]
MNPALYALVMSGASRTAILVVAAVLAFAWLVCVVIGLLAGPQRRSAGKNAKARFLRFCRALFIFSP